MHTDLWYTVVQVETAGMRSERNALTDETNIGGSMKQSRAQWMAAFGEAIVAYRPDYAGRIDWNSAMYFFNAGYGVEDAVARYLTTPR